jgi:hypothetical protein
MNDTDMSIQLREGFGELAEESLDHGSSMVFHALLFQQLQSFEPIDRLHAEGYSSVMQCGYKILNVRGL